MQLLRGHLAAAIRHLALAWSLLSGLPAQPADAPPLNELESAALAALAEPDNVVRRGMIRPVFQLADRYAAQGDTAKAMNLYTQGLTVQPWNLQAQWAVAKLLDAAGDTNAARAKALLVWENAETGDLLAPAAARLTLPFAHELPTASQPPERGLCLVPIGDTESWLVLQLRDELARVLRIPVVVRPLSLSLPAPQRDPLHARAEDLRARLTTSLRDGRFKVLAAQLGLTTNTLATDEGVFAFSVRVLSTEPDKQLARQVDEELGFLRRMGSQWDAGILAGQLAKAGAVKARTDLGYLGVTQADLFSGASRFVFGVAAINENYGVMSYRRFLASSFDTPPNRRRLVERALKQALSSAGLLFGLPRCTDPHCARAYANNLEEHDAKKPEFCVECQQAFAKRLPVGR